MFFYTMFILLTIFLGAIDNVNDGMAPFPLPPPPHQRDTSTPTFTTATTSMYPPPPPPHIDVDNGPGGRRSLRAPPFFTSQGEKGSNGEFFPPGSEAERRISFFAQSLTTNIPLPLHVDAMPTFTVLTPHYSEKVRAFS